MSYDNEPILRVDKLSVGVKSGKEILQGISFVVPTGKRIAIVGESGSGKTFTAKSIMSMLPSNIWINGAIYFQGINLVNQSKKEKCKIRGKKIGMIFQDPMTSLNPTMKIGNQISEAYRTHNPSAGKKLAKEKTLELLDLVGIPDPELRYRQYPYELSGGMRQRVVIAIALAPSPELLIADEPTTALDVTIQAQILDLLKHIQAKTATSIILITHDLGIVAEFCEEVIVMKNGEIVETGNVEQIFSNPRHPYTKILLNALPNLSQDLAHQQGDQEDKITKNRLESTFLPSNNNCSQELMHETINKN